MSNYRSMIDQALEAARARAHTPVETVKAASAEDALIKEANDLANALEFVSLSASGGDNAAGFRQEMIRDFYKSATSPAQGPTAASGVQGIAPAAGKKKLAPVGLVGGNSPVQGSTTPEARDGQKTLLESFKQGSGQSLYDMLMSNKTAGAGGPAEHDSETMAGVGTANENSTYRKTLHTNEGPVNANRRDLKKNTRARLAEVFGHTNDTLGDATAAQIFPQAASRGNLKIASASRTRRLLQVNKEAGMEKEAILGAVRNLFRGGANAAAGAAPKLKNFKKAPSAAPNTPPYYRPTPGPTPGPTPKSGRYQKYQKARQAAAAGPSFRERIRNFIGTPEEVAKKRQAITDDIGRVRQVTDLVTDTLPNAVRGIGDAGQRFLNFVRRTPQPAVQEGMSDTTKALLGIGGATAAGGLGLMALKGMSSDGREATASAFPLTLSLLEKRADQLHAGLGGLAFGPLGAGVGADNDRGFRAMGGSLVGGTAGGMLGALPGLALNAPGAASLGGALGGMLGSGLGGYMGHGSISDREKLLVLKQKAELEAARQRGEI